MNDRQVLVVKVKAANGLSDLTAMREYVMDCVRRGVLVLDSGTVFSVENLPDVPASPVVVSIREDVLAAPTKPDTPTLAEEKMSILLRLQEYRKTNGVGCLADVARKTRDKSVTAEFLRLLLSGDAQASIATWRRISSALANLEPVPDAADEVTDG